MISQVDTKSLDLYKWLLQNLAVEKYILNKKSNLPRARSVFIPQLQVLFSIAQIFFNTHFLHPST